MTSDPVQVSITTSITYALEMALIIKFPTQCQHALASPTARYPGRGPIASSGGLGLVALARPFP